MRIVSPIGCLDDGLEECVLDDRVGSVRETVDVNVVLQKRSELGSFQLVRLRVTVQAKPENKGDQSCGGETDTRLCSSPGIARTFASFFAVFSGLIADAVEMYAFSSSDEESSERVSLNVDSAILGRSSSELWTRPAGQLHRRI